MAADGILLIGVSTSKTTFLVYGQTKVDDGDHAGPKVLDLLAAKRKIRPPPNKAVVRPGDPLPRRKIIPSLASSRAVLMRTHLLQNLSSFRTQNRLAMPSPEGHPRSSRIEASVENPRNRTYTLHHHPPGLSRRAKNRYRRTRGKRLPQGGEEKREKKRLMKGTLKQMLEGRRWVGS